jgi:hypothetical protein
LERTNTLKYKPWLETGWNVGTVCILGIMFLFILISVPLPYPRAIDWMDQQDYTVQIVTEGKKGEKIQFPFIQQQQQQHDINDFGTQS